MARQQFEDQFRNKLNNREIKPSAGSWQQLAGKLDSAENTSKPILWWIGIAATIAGGVLIYSLAFNFNPDVKSPGVVDNPSEEMLQDKEIPVQENTSLVVEESTQEENLKKEEITGKAKSSAESNKPAEKSDPVTHQRSKSQIASAQKYDKLEEKENTPVSPETAEESLVITKLEELIAEIDSKGSGDATYAEIDALLYKAAGEITKEQGEGSLSGTIDAGDLLFDVEMELEQSFREKVFDLLKEGYSKARTAVANRNY